MVKTPIKSNLDEFERLFLALGDKTRLKLLTLMANEPVTVGFLVDQLGESQPKVSRHLAYLRNSGVVTTRRDGKCIYYGFQQASDPDLDRIVEFVIGIISGETLAGSTVAPRSHPVETAEDVPLAGARKARRAPRARSDEPEESPQPRSEPVEFYSVYQEEDADESTVESDMNDGELEVFLL